MTILQPTTLGPAFATFADDTEESILGSSVHQGAITALSDCLNACGQRRGLPWFVGNQIRMIVHRAGQRSLILSPDILIHPTLTAMSRDSILVAHDGPPALVIEVASPTTAVQRDLSDDGKPAAYAALGVAEYLVFDPTGEFISDNLWARRLGPQGYIPWEPDPTDGRWHSELGIAFQPQSMLLRVYDQDGQLVPTDPEVREQLQQSTAELRAQAAQRRAQAAELQAQAERIAALEAELRRLRGE